MTRACGRGQKVHPGRGRGRGVPARVEAGAFRWKSAGGPGSFVRVGEGRIFTVEVGSGPRSLARTPSAVSRFCRGGSLGLWPYQASGMSATLDLKSKEEKDAELDKRIEALRRKNEALIRRYQEIEEDRKKAELEGVAVTAPRKGRLLEKENVAVEVEKNHGPSRRSPGTPRPPGASRGGRAAPQQGGRAGVGRTSRSWEDSPGEQPRGGAGGRGRRGRGRGSPHLSGAGDASTADRRSKEWEERRRQNIEKMNEEMEKIAEYERNQREGVLEPNPVRNFLDDPRRRGGPLEEPERDRREGSRRHGRNWGGPDFERVRCGLEQERQGRRAGPGSAGDMTLSMTGRERSEYLRWKQEREKIDQERLQRHRKPTGQWRREWDAEKTDGMFKDGPAVALEPSHRYDDQSWTRPPKPPTFREFLSQHKAEVSRRKRKSSRPQAKAAPRAYSDHDDRWETKEAAAPAPEAPQPTPPEETTTKPPATPAPVHRPPEDQGEEDDGGEDEGEEDEGEDEEWEDVSGDEEVVEEEEEADEEEEEEPAQDQEPQELEPTGRSPSSEQADKEPSGPEEPPPLPQAPASPSSPFSPPGGHQPVSDWGEEMELNSPRTAHPADALSPGGDQPVLASLESGPSIPGTQKAEEEGSEAAPEAGPEGQETAEITDFQRASPNS
ncbi:coiled-coil domain-containing protein 9 isoform X2 [Pteropus alecto]|uniref:coiled-coil domain-containing protein 9 isoform X2 n=1 Tax=Pteropus alecto TaxID=9402 RepID=UPI000D533A4D|nr:coiled-coil domain-containing protein 9 isoform X2 [Pteropus alecto]